MSESKPGKTLLIVVLVLFGGGGFVAYPMVQWFRLEVAARDVISDNHISRFPDAEKLLSVIPELKATGAKLSNPGLEVTIKLEQRHAGPAIMWFLSIRIKNGSKEFETEKRVETEWQEDELEILRDAGVVVRRLSDDE